MSDFKAFIAGFLSTLVFHQGLLAILHAAGLVARGAYAAAPTGPLHVPAFVSLAFWGGIWALALARLVRRLPPGAYWVAWTGLGAVLPSLVAWFVVFPLKGAPVAGGWAPGFLAASLLLNGAWGFGAGLIMRTAQRGLLMH
jgi:hypothetical protein